MAKAKISTFKGSLEELFKVSQPAIVVSLSLMKFEGIRTLSGVLELCYICIRRPLPTRKLTQCQ